ncbi:hypothetical protein [Candidatus Symbiopectobacterium sp. 'North America']|uniref:hypothetical protein n=1 Tax=Candidatus Symbiopectobacterium sp. 'North America' TaxID=2794574 RepID=UPI0018C9456A|nr:hypothetical protein [Candidatus Symbiopectobacterium sp. 'North America']
MDRIGSTFNESLFMRAMREDVSRNPEAAIYNKGITNSYVTELNAYHKPDQNDPQRRDISETLSKLKHANSGEERGASQGRMKDMLSEIINYFSELREKRLSYIISIQKMFMGL